MVRREPRRGMENLLRALRMLSSKRLIQVDLFGPAWVDPGAAFFPYVHHGVLSRAETAQLLSRADIVVDPSAFHGFGLIGLEAMASGTPSVLTDCGGIGEYFGVDPTIVRLLWVLFTLISIGVGLVAYIVAWIIVPEEK